MTKIYSFITGSEFFTLGTNNPPEEDLAAVYTACALTCTGKWLAGAVSQDINTAIERCHKMAIDKIAKGGVLSDPDLIFVKCHPGDISQQIQQDISNAMKKAFERLP